MRKGLKVFLTSIAVFITFFFISLFGTHADFGGILSGLFKPYTPYPTDEWEYLLKEEEFYLEIDNLEYIYQENKKLQKGTISKKEYTYYKVVYDDKGQIIGIGDVTTDNFKIDEEFLIKFNKINELFEKNLGTMDSVGFCPNGRFTFLSNSNFAVVRSPKQDLDYYKYDGDGIEFDVYELDRSWYFLKSDLPKK